MNHNRFRRLKNFPQPLLAPFAFDLVVWNGLANKAPESVTDDKTLALLRSPARCQTAKANLNALPQP